MAPAASATQKPVTPVSVPATATPPAQPAAAQPAPAQAAATKPAAAPAPATAPAGAKVEAKAAASVDTKKAADKKDKKDDKKKFNPEDLKHIGFGVGFGWLCEELNNGVSKFDDHCGEYLELNPEYRHLIGKEERHEVDIGAYWSKFWVDRTISTAPGLPADRSRASADSLGLSVGYKYHAIPRWLAVGARGKVGYVEYNSDQGEINPDTGSYPEGQFGTVVNAGKGYGASSYPLNGAGGMEASLGLGLYTLGGGFGVRSEFFWHPGVSLHAETVTQGAFDQPINPSGIKFIGFVIDPFAAYQAIAGKQPSKPTPAPTRTPLAARPANPPVAAAATTAPAAKAEPTVEDRVKNIAAIRGSILALVEGNEEKKVKGNKQIEKEMQEVIAAKPSVLGSQEAKDKRIAELAKLANTQAAGAQLLYGDALKEKAAIEAKINAMPEGEEKKKYQESFKKWEEETFQVKQDNTTTMAELVNQAYTSHEKVKAAYEAYVKKHPNTPKVDLDTPKPETMNTPAPVAKAKPAEAPKPAAKPAAAAPAAKPAEKPAAKPAEKPAEKPAAKPAEKPAEKKKSTSEQLDDALNGF